MTKNNSGDEVDKNFKSKFLSDAERMKEKLDSVSPSMCLAKWKQVSLHLTTGHNNSCYHPPLHKINRDEIKRNPAALHNTEHKKQQRKLMLEGTRPKECSYCWAMEDNGKLSDRHYRSGEPWAADHFNNVVNADWDADVTPSYVEVNFNSACNLKCSYCSPQFSTTWMEEIDRHGAYPTSTPHNAPEYFKGDRRRILNREQNPYVEAFWKWWPDLYPELKHFRMTGGEPLMDKNTYRVFDHVLQNPKSDLHLAVTSNFSVTDKLWQKYKSYVNQLCQGETIEHYMQYVSVDTWGDQAEYIRNGLDFELLWDRVHEFLNDIPYRNSLTFIITMNNLSVPNLDKLLSGILELRKTYSKTYQRVWFDTPVLHTPKWQSMQLLPESYAFKLRKIRHWMEQNIETEETRFHGFKDYEINRLDRDIAWMREELNEEDKKRRMADFYRFFSEHDSRRSTSFVDTFPEMAEWWNECQRLCNTHD